MVKTVALLLLQPRVYGIHENGSQESYNPEEFDNQKVGGYGWSYYILAFLLHTVMEFGFGMYIGYMKWGNVFWWHKN